MNNTEKKFNEIIDEIFVEVANGELSPNSTLFRAAAAAKKTMTLQGVLSQQVNRKYRGKRKAMLEHCLSVVESIYNEKLGFTNACKKRASKLGVKISSIQQACCRALGLKASNWHKMIDGNIDEKNNIVRKLCLIYPDEKLRINNLFENHNINLI